MRAIRKMLGLTQASFAWRFGFGLPIVRDWEQGRHQPDQAVQAFLVTIERQPIRVRRALQRAAT